MPYDYDEPIEVKIGGSLGSWVPGTLVGYDYAQTDGRPGRRVYTVHVNGKTINDVPERHVRHPRKTATPRIAARAKPSRPKRNDKVEIGRGPLRFPAYRKWVKSKPCIFCQQKADDPHHYGPKGTGQTTDDTRIVPVCRTCHGALHARRPQDFRDRVLPLNDPHHEWATVERHIYSCEVSLLTEYLRYHDGMMS